MFIFPRRGPITRSGSDVEIPGKKHSSSTATIIKSTNGSVPQITSLKRNIRRDVADDEDVQADRRMNQSHLHHDGHDDAEPDDVEIGGAQRRQDDRRGHQDDRNRRQEEAEHDDHDQDRRQQFPARQVHRDDRFGGRLRDVQVAHHVGIEQRHADDHHQHGGFADRRFQDRRQVARPPHAVDHARSAPAPAVRRGPRFPKAWHSRHRARSSRRSAAARTAAPAAAR